MTPELKDRISKIRNGEVPEGYKKTVCGIIPNEWDNYKLCDISDELTERVGDRTYETLSISAGIGFVNQANKFGKELSGKQYEKYIVLRKNDFSYNKGNSKKYPQGCVYKLKDRESAAVPNVFESFRLSKGNDDYYEQLFVSGFLNKQLSAKINHGVRDDGLLNLTGKDFYSNVIPFPPLPEQQKIAEILSTQDKVIALEERCIKELKKLKKAYLQKMFPKKGEVYPEIRFKGFTDAWEQREVKELCSISSGKSNTQDKTDDGEYPFYVRSPIIERSTKYLYDEEAVITVGDGVGTGKVFHYVNGKYDLHQRCYRMYGFTEELNARYFYHTFSHLFYKRVMAMTAKTSVDSVRLEMISDMEIPTPSIEEQKQIGQYFTNLDNLITLHQRKLEQEKQKKKALMQLLLTGIVRIKV